MTNRCIKQERFCITNMFQCSTKVTCLKPIPNFLRFAGARVVSRSLELENRIRHNVEQMPLALVVNKQSEKSLPNILFEKGVYDWIGCSVDDHHKMNCLIQCVRNNACCEYKAITNVISSSVSGIEERDNQYNHGCCSPLGMSRVLDDIDLWKSIIIANLSFQCSGLAPKLVGNVNQNASDQHKDDGGNNLKHKNSVDLKYRCE